MAFWNDWLKKSIQGEINDLLKQDGVVSEGDNAPSPTRGAYSADSLPDVAEDHDASKQIGRAHV